MRRWIITEDEDEALQGLPILAQVLYLRGIRPFMDRTNGVAGIKRGISYQGLRETMYVEPTPGRTQSGAPTKMQLRRALWTLKDAGLIGIKTEGKRMAFLCLKALKDQSARKQPITNRSQTEHTQPNTTQPNGGGASAEQPITNRSQTEHTQPNTHQLSVVSSKTDANASGAAIGADAVDNSPEMLVKKLFDFGVEILTPPGPDADEEPARKMVGKLRKVLGDGGALEALVAARATTDPMSYLHKVVHNGKDLDAWQECLNYLSRGRPKDFQWSDPLIEQACKRVGSELYTASTREAEAIFRRSYSEVRARH